MKWIQRFDLVTWLIDNMELMIHARKKRVNCKIHAGEKKKEKN